MWGAAWEAARVGGGAWGEARVGGGAGRRVWGAVRVGGCLIDGLMGGHF